MTWEKFIKSPIKMIDKERGLEFCTYGAIRSGEVVLDYRIDHPTYQDEQTYAIKGPNNLFIPFCIQYNYVNPNDKNNSLIKKHMTILGISRESSDRFQNSYRDGEPIRHRFEWTSTLPQFEEYFDLIIDGYFNFCKIYEMTMKTWDRITYICPETKRVFERLKPDTQK